MSARPSRRAVSLFPSLKTFVLTVVSLRPVAAQYAFATEIRWVISIMAETIFGLFPEYVNGFLPECIKCLNRESYRHA